MFTELRDMRIIKVKTKGSFTILSQYNNPVLADHIVLDKVPKEGNMMTISLSNLP